MQFAVHTLKIQLWTVHRVQRFGVTEVVEPENIITVAGWGFTGSRASRVRSWP